MIIHAVLSLICFAVLAGSVCHFPSDLIGVWKHSFHGNLDFVNSSQFLMTIAEYKNVPGNCHTQVNNDTYLIVSGGIKAQVQPNAFLTIRVGICLQMEKIKTNLYKLTHLTGESSLAQFARLSLVFDPSNVKISAVCNDNTTDARKEYKLLMKVGSVDSVIEECPPQIHGRLNLNFNSTSCSSNIDVCSDNTTLQINNTCSSAVAYSESGHVSCIHSENNLDTTVLWTYNRDEVTNEKTTFLFTCYMFEENGNSIIGTQNPRFCDATQNATTKSTGSTNAELWGAYVSGTIDYCVSTTTTTTASPTTVKQISRGATLTSNYKYVWTTLFLVGVLLN